MSKNETEVTKELIESRIDEKLLEYYINIDLNPIKKNIAFTDIDRVSIPDYPIEKVRKSVKKGQSYFRRRKGNGVIGKTRRTTSKNKRHS